MPTQPLGWFKKPITKAEDFKGLKFRTVGISIDVFTGLGAAVNALPGGEIVPAMDRGLLDAAEFNNATSDRILGFPDVSKVCMLQSYHQNAEQFEIMFNKAKFDALPAKMKAIIENAVEAASPDMSWKAIDRYSQGLHRDADRSTRCEFYKTPDSVLQRQLDGLRRRRPKKRADNALFKEIEESQKRVRRARGALGPRHQRQPPHGLQPLLRQGRAASRQRRRPERRQHSDQTPSGAPGWCFFERTDGSSMQKAPALRRQGQHLGRPGVLLAHRRRSRCQVTWEVFSRYALDAPHAWAFDVMIMFYGTLFMMAGAYTLAKNGHVRGDVLYGFFKPRTQATIDLMLYIVFFIPGVFALTYAGYYYAADSWRINEHSNITADGPPIYPFKTIIPLAGAFLLVQGIVEIVRCIICLKQGYWPSREQDVEEVDVDKLKEMVHVKDEDIQKLDELVVRAGGGASEDAQGAVVRLLADGDHRRSPIVVFMPWSNLTNGHLGLLMLALIVVAIMLGFPTAFTLMGMGVFFAWLAYRSVNPRPRRPRRCST